MSSQRELQNVKMEHVQDSRDMFEVYKEELSHQRMRLPRVQCTSLVWFLVLSSWNACRGWVQDKIPEPFQAHFRCMVTDHVGVDATNGVYRVWGFRT